jgi:transcriptional regulator with XRE-family HTH domain
MRYNYGLADTGWHEKWGTMAERMPTKTVRETVADNVRAFRQLRDIDQAALARRMLAVGIGWRQVTVSEVEREHRNITVAELLGLALTLGTTVEQLLDPRGPERIRGPGLSIGYAQPAVEDGQPAIEGYLDAIPPQFVTGLVCTHADYPVVKWDEQTGTIKSLSFEKVQPQ